MIDTLPAAGNSYYPRKRTVRFTRYPILRHGTPAPRTESRRWQPVPEQRLGFCAKKGHNFGSGTLVVLSRPRRCRILNALSGFFQCFLPRKLEGPVPGPGIGRIGSSPALRTAAHVGLTAKDRALLSRWRPQRTSLAQSSPLQQPLNPQPTEAHGAPHQVSQTRGGIPFPRITARRWTTGPARHSRQPFPHRSHGGAVDLLRCPFTLRLELLRKLCPSHHNCGVAIEQG